jgi:hypothetical protein
MAASRESLLNVPVPEVVQRDEMALPPLEPDTAYVLPAQIVASAPALQVAAGWAATVTESLTEEQEVASVTVTR